MLVFYSWLLGIIAALPAGVQSGGPGVEFHWEAVAGCPLAAEVAANVEHFLEQPLTEQDAQRMKLSMQVRRAVDDSFAANLQLVRDGAVYEREVLNADCKVLAEGAAHVGAMMLESGRTEGSSDALHKTVESPVRETVAVRAAPPTVLAPRKPAPASVPARRPRFGLRVGGGISYADLPGPTALLRLTTALLWPNVRVEIEISYEPLLKARFYGDRDRGADLQFAGAAVRGCPVLRLRRVELPVCAGVEAGMIAGRSVGLDAGTRGSVGLAAAHLAPAVFYVPHPRIAVGMLVDGALRLVRPQLHIAGYGAVYQPALLALRVLTSLEVRFR